MKRLFAIDWAYEDAKLAVYDGKRILAKLPKLNADDIVLVENIPSKMARPIFDVGAHILRCRPNDISEFRENIGWGKTDDTDAILIWQLYERAPEKFREWAGDPPLIGMYRAFKEIQKERVRQGNRLWHKGDDIIEETTSALEAIEVGLLKKIRKELATKPIWIEWMKDVYGVGESIGGGVIGYIEKTGIANFATPSALWAYAGLGVVDGHAPRREKGMAATYNPKLKTLLLGGLGDSLVKSSVRSVCDKCGEQVSRSAQDTHSCQSTYTRIGKSIYADVYLREKIRQGDLRYERGYLAERFRGYKPEDTKLKPLHIERRARRKAVKVFMLHTWLVWRALEGLPLRAPYALEYGGHSTFIEPEGCPPRILEAIRATIREAVLV